MRKFRQFIPDEDSPLLLSWHRGDLSAFETLTWKYQKRIFNLALILTGNHESAAAAAENSFLTAFQEIRSLTVRSRFSSWLVAIALNECRDLNNFRAEESSLSELLPVSGSPDVTDAAELSGMMNKLALCLKDLPVELTEVILLRYVRGYSLEKMEEIFQLRPDIILSRLFEAEEALTACLKGGTFRQAGTPGHKAEEPVTPHPEIRRTFSAYLDNAADHEEKETTRDHLKSCGICREALADLEWMIEHLKSLPDEEPPHWLASSIIQKIKTTPKKRTVIKKPSHTTIQVAVGTLFLAVIGFSAYILTNSDNTSTSNPGIETSRVGRGPVTPDRKSDPGSMDLTALLKGAFRGTGSSENKKPVTSTTAPSPLASPQGKPPAAAPAAIVPTPKAEQPAVSSKPEQLQKRERPENAPQLPTEWGDSAPSTRTSQKKPPLRRNSGEIAVVLATSDPIAAIQEIEASVTSLGGRITGRAYSSGKDILYTRIEVDRLIELIGRLGKVGTVQELPELPDDADRMIDLVIRW